MPGARQTNQGNDQSSRVPRLVALPCCMLSLNSAVPAEADPLLCLRGGHSCQGLSPTSPLLCLTKAPQGFAENRATPCQEERHCPHGHTATWSAPHVPAPHPTLQWRRSNITALPLSHRLLWPRTISPGPGLGQHRSCHSLHRDCGSRAWTGWDASSSESQNSNSGQFFTTGSPKSLEAW